MGFLVVFAGGGGVGKVIFGGLGFFWVGFWCFVLFFWVFFYPSKSLLLDLSGSFFWASLKSF